MGTEPRPPVDRRRIDEVFGDVLPDTTSDEREQGARGQSGSTESAESERWYVDNRPPHHDR